MTIQLEAQNVAVDTGLDTGFRRFVVTYQVAPHEAYVTIASGPADSTRWAIVVSANTPELAAQVAAYLTNYGLAGHPQGEFQLIGVADVETRR